jgi:hypothetical protein
LINQFVIVKVKFIFNDYDEAIMRGIVSAKSLLVLKNLDEEDKLKYEMIIKDTLKCMAVGYIVFIFIIRCAIRM